MIRTRARTTITITEGMVGVVLGATVVDEGGAEDEDVDADVTIKVTHVAEQRNVYSTGTRRTDEHGSTIVRASRVPRSMTFVLSW